MARLHRLKAAFVKTAKPGIYGDGGGLWLRVTEGADGSINRVWIFRFARNGKAHGMGLGPTDIVGLAEAREAAIECRKLLHKGLDPIEHRRQQRAAAQVEVRKVPTFRQAAEQYIGANEAGWSPAHWRDYTGILERHGYPVIGDVRIDAVDTEHVLKAVQPLWVEKTETAARLRGRIEQILDFAKVKGWREGENPARWKGHLAQVLPKRSKVKKTEHRAAIDYREMPAFMAKLRTVKDSPAVRALEFVALTAARSNEVREMEWPDVNFEERVWTVPASKMKSGKEHRVPLSDRAIEILREMQQLRTGSLVFGSMGRMRLLLTMRKFSSTDSVHGLRSSFRDWTAECTSTPNHVAEMALAHAVGNGVEAAYRRGDLFEKRRKLMNQWSAYCSKSAAEVVQLRTAK
jgi:integrase